MVVSRTSTYSQDAPAIEASGQSHGEFELKYLTKEYSNFSRGRVEMALRGTQGRGKLQGVEFIVPELWEGADAVPLSPPLLSPVFLSLISPALLHPLPFLSLVQTQSLVQAMQVTQALTMPSVQPSSFF